MLDANTSEEDDAMSSALELRTQLEARPGVCRVRVDRNEFGAFEVSFCTPYADPGREGWAVGETAAEALQEALYAEEFLRSSALAKARGTP